MYVYMYVCMYVCRQVGRYVGMHVGMYVCMYVCRALSSLSVLSSTRFHLICQCSTSSTKSTFLGKSLLGIEQSINSLLTTRFDISSTKLSKVSKKTRYRDIFQWSDELSTGSFALCTFILYTLYIFKHGTYLHAYSSKKVEH